MLIWCLNSSLFCAQQRRSKPIHKPSCRYSRNLASVAPAINRKWGYFQHLMSLCTNAANLALSWLWRRVRFLGDRLRLQFPSPRTKGKLTHNYTAFVHSQEALWGPPGMCSPRRGQRSITLPLHMLNTGSGGPAKRWPHPVIPHGFAAH